MTLSSVEEALVRLGTRCVFGLIFGIGLALIISGEGVYIAFGGLMCTAVLPECLGLAGLHEQWDVELLDDEVPNDG